LESKHNKIETGGIDLLTVTINRYSNYFILDLSDLITTQRKSILIYRNIEMLMNHNETHLDFSIITQLIQLRIQKFKIQKS